jgi:adenine nucleotide transporter 17
MSDRVAAPTPSNPLPAATQPQAQAQNAPLGSPAGQVIASQQSDNVAHALAGAGGGLLSMALTCVTTPVGDREAGWHTERIADTL